MCQDSLLETEQYKGYEIEIHADYHPANPIKDWDMLGTMVCAHSRYTLGHVRVDNGLDIFPEILGSNGVRDALVGESREDWLYHGSLDEEDTGRLWAAVDKAAITLPLYLYDHGNITMRTGAFSCPWDSGQVGVVYVLKEAVRKEWGWKLITKSRRKKIENLLRAEVQVYDNYLTGSVYGYVVKDQEGFDIDSCWGFYGYDNEKSGLMEYARGAVDHDVERIANLEKQEAEERARGEATWTEMLVATVEQY